MHHRRPEVVVGRWQIRMQCPHEIIAAVHESQEGQESGYHSDVDEYAEQDSHCIPQRIEVLIFPAKKKNNLCA